LPRNVGDQLAHVADLGRRADQRADHLFRLLSFGYGDADDPARFGNLTGDFGDRRRQLFRCRRHGIGLLAGLLGGSGQ
jgi:hypothetical protein